MSREVYIVKRIDRGRRNILLRIVFLHVAPRARAHSVQFYCPPCTITMYPRRNRVYRPSLWPNRAGKTRTVAPLVRLSVHLAAFIFRPNEIESPANGMAKKIMGRG